jgi:protein gp37
MAQASNIEWCDGTWPVVQGCDYDSPGCIHCYAVGLIWRQMHHPNPKISGPVQGLVERRDEKLIWTGKVALRGDRLGWPLQWTKPLKIFVPSHGDLFHDAVPDAFIDQVFAVAALCPHHTLQVLSKRSPRMRVYMRAIGNGDEARWSQALQRWAGKVSSLKLGDALEFLTRRGPLRNVWLGVSVEDQKRKARIDDLRATPAAVRFISFEPLLEDLGDVDLTGIHQAITGGESGHRRRPHDVEWQRSILRQCRAQGVAFFGKQDDKVRPLPPDLMIREFPKVPA